MHPWRSAPPASVFWTASARPPSSPRVAPKRPAPPQCGHLIDRERERDSFPLGFCAGLHCLLKALSARGAKCVRTLRNLGKYEK